MQVQEEMLGLRDFSDLLVPPEKLQIEGVGVHPIRC